MTEQATLQITAYNNGEYAGLDFPIVSAFPRRDWMNFHGGQPYRCLPMTMANQLGWFLLNPVGFVAEWQAEEVEALIRVEYDEPLTDDQKFLGWYFGNGILTWHMPYLFRTAPSYNLLARGPANSPKDGIQALEGMIETDWLDATFTMNWKFTRARHPLRFEKGEPFCMIMPVRRGEIERFEPNIELLKDNLELHAAFDTWDQKRQKYLNEAYWRKKLAQALKRPIAAKYDLSYMRGQTASGEAKIPDHQTRLDLKPFKRSWQKQFYHLLNLGRKNDLDWESREET